MKSVTGSHFGLDDIVVLTGEALAGLVSSSPILEPCTHVLEDVGHFLKEPEQCFHIGVGAEAAAL